MFHLAFNHEEFDCDHSDLYILTRKYVHAILMKEIGEYLGSENIQHVTPESSGPQSYFDEIPSGFHTEKIMQIIPENFSSWLLENGIDPVVFTVKKLYQLVRIIKSEEEEYPDLYHCLLIASMGKHGDSRKTFPFRERQLLVDSMIDYYDEHSDDFDEIGRDEYIVYIKNVFKNLYGMIDTEEKWDAEIVFENDDYELLNCEEGPVAGFGSLYIGYNDYPRPTINYIFTSVGEPVPTDLAIQLDLISEFAMRMFRLSIQQEILVHALGKAPLAGNPDKSKMS